MFSIFKRSQVPLRTIEIPVPPPETPKAPAAKSCQCGKCITIRYATGGIEQFIVDDEDKMRREGAAVVICDIDGSHHQIMAAYVCSIAIEDAVKCGSCGAYVVPERKNMYMGELHAEGIAICPECGKKIEMEE